MRKPPIVGATAIGTRRRIACTVNPIARRSRGSASPTTAKSAGLAMLDHAMTSASPAKTYGDEGDERASAAVAVGDPAAGILVRAVEKVARTPVEADRRDRRAKCLEVLRH